MRSFLERVGRSVNPMRCVQPNVCLSFRMVYYFRPNLLHTLICRT